MIWLSDQYDERSQRIFQRKKQPENHNSSSVCELAEFHQKRFEVRGCDAEQDVVFHNADHNFDLLF